MGEFFDEKTKSKIKVILTKGGLSLIPFVGKVAAVGYDLKNVLVERAKEIRSKDAEERVNAFHDQLFKHNINVNDENAEEFLGDYTRILENMIRDDESEKAQYYANLLNFYANQPFINTEEKVFLLSSLKALSRFEVELIQKIFISKNFRLTSDPIPKSRAIYGPAINKIAQLGLFDKDGEDVEATKAGKFFADAIFMYRDLTPDAIGCKIFRATELSLICFYDLENGEKLGIRYIIDAIKQVLSKNDFVIPSAAQINSRHPDIDNRHLTILNYNVILIYDKYFSPVKLLKLLERLNVIKIYLQDDDSPDPLKDFEGDTIHSYRVMNQREQIQDLIDEIWDKHLASLL
jgi:hypothetical protein